MTVDLLRRAVPFSQDITFRKFYISQDLTFRKIQKGKRIILRNVIFGQMANLAKWQKKIINGTRQMK